MNKLEEFILLFTLTIVCIGLSFFRIYYTGNLMYIFLNWNLFLAFIPWLLTTIALLKPNIKRNKISISILLISWLLIFPNAPYILTDLFHLSKGSSMPIWFDLLLILSFAWTGLLYGFFSLWDIEKIIGHQVTPKWKSMLIIGLIILSSFGIYLGRYLRWNSWDIVSEPLALIYDISERIFDPFSHPRAWGMTLLMGLFLNSLYWSFRVIKGKRH